MNFTSSFYVEPVGISGGLCLWWNKDVSVKIISASKNIIDTYFCFKNI